MLKVLIVDDEPLIRQGLKSIIDWKGYGFDICGEADNGKSGLDMIQNLKPDVAVIDIKMPQMNGLELVEEVKKLGMDLRVIILTAYSDFKFAQEAIDLGIDSYILKPIEKEELIQKVSRIRESLIKDRMEKRYVDESILLSKEKVIKTLVTGKMDEEQLKEYEKFYCFGFPWKCYQIALIDTESGGAALNPGIKYGAEDFIYGRNYGFVFETGRFIGVLFKDIFFTSFHRILMDLKKNIYDSGGEEVIISLGTVAYSSDDINTSYKHASDLMDRKFIYGHKKIIVHNIGEADFKNTSKLPKKSFDFDKMAEELCNAIDVNNMDSINNILEQLGCYFSKNEYNESFIKANYSHVYMMLVDRLFPGNEMPGHAIYVKRDFMKQIYEKTSLQELHGLFKYHIISISNELSKMRPDNPMKKIIDYIERKYNKDIKLEGIAKLFNYNSAYLGKLFKNSTGMYFNTYLDNIRMNKAKEFLKEGLRVHEVAEKTGYKDSDYFYRKFRKYTGISPSDYKTKSDINEISQ